jgi:hypothetical protein
MHPLYASSAIHGTIEFNFNEDPDIAFHSYAETDPGPASQNNADAVPYPWLTDRKTIATTQNHSCPMLKGIQCKNTNHLE